MENLSQTKNERKKYADWAEEYPNFLVLLKTGYFYSARGRSAEVLNEVLNYKLIYTTRKKCPTTGGPSLSVIVDALVKNKINYIVVDCGKIVDKEVFPECAEVFYDSSFFSNSSFAAKENKTSEVDMICTIEALLNGVNPETGELLTDNQLLLINTVQSALQFALKTVKRKQNDEKKRPSAGTKWSQEEDLRLIEEYKNQISIKDIAKMHGRSRGAIMSRMIHLQFDDEDSSNNKQ